MKMGFLKWNWSKIKEKFVLKNIRSTNNCVFLLIWHFLKKIYNIVKSFAKNNFNIDNFDYFVANRQLFKYCFDICTKYANDELSISEYFEIIKKTGMKSVSFYKIALSYGAVVEKINKEQLALMTIQIQPSNKVLNLLEKTEEWNIKIINFIWRI